MSLGDFALMTLASAAILEAWFKGSIFALRRAKFEESDGRFAELMTCPFCLSYHAPWLAALLLWLPGLWLDGSWREVSRVPLYSLSITFLLNRVRQWIT